MNLRNFIKSIIFEHLKENSEGSWSNGVWLDNDQIFAITTSEYSGQQRYYFNKIIHKFIPVIQMDSYNIDDFNCTMHEVDLAKKIANDQHLNPDVEWGKVRCKK